MRWLDMTTRGCRATRAVPVRCDAGQSTSCVCVYCLFASPERASTLRHAKIRQNELSWRVERSRATSFGITMAVARRDKFKILNKYLNSNILEFSILKRNHCSSVSLLS